MRALIWLLVLSLLEGSSWFLPSARVGSAALCGLEAGCAAGLYGLTHCLRVEGRDDSSWLLPAVSAGAIALPAVLLALAQGLVSGTTGAIILAATPLVSVCTLQVLATDAGDLGQTLLPSLAGLAGTLLLLPFHSPLSRAGTLGLVLDLAAAVAAGVFGTWARHLARPLGAATRMRQVALGNAAAFLLGALLLAAVQRGNPSNGASTGAPLTAVEWSVAGASVLATQAVGLWCLGELEPVVFACRFVLIPLVMAVEGWVLWRPSVTAREGIAGVLMALSVGFPLAERTPMPRTILPPAAE